MPAQIDRRPGASQDSSGLMLYASSWKTISHSFLGGDYDNISYLPYRIGFAGAWLEAYEFTAGNLEFGWFSFQIPHDYAPGTDLIPYVAFAPSTDEVAGDSMWQFEYLCAQPGEVFASSTYDQFIEPVIANTQWQHHVAHGLIVPDCDNSFVPGSVIVCRIGRVGDNVQDTYVGGLIGLTCGFHYQSDRDGTVSLGFDPYDVASSEGNPAA